MSNITKRDLIRRRAELRDKATAILDDTSKPFAEQRAEVDSLIAEVDRLTARLDLMVNDDDVAEDERSAPASAVRSVVRSKGRKSAPLDTGSSVAAEFSIGNAIRGILTNSRLDDREAEISERTARLMGRATASDRFFVPMNQRGILDTTNGAGGVMTVTDNSEFIELLRTKLVTNDLGVTFLSGLQGNVKIPRQTGAATAAFTSEGSTASATNQTIDYISLTPKMLIASTTYSRHFLVESGIDTNRFVTDDLTAVIARAIDNAVFNGSGSGANPLGLLNQGSLPTVSLGTNGGAPTWQTLNQLEETVQLANGILDPSRVAWVTNPTAARVLRTTTKAGSTYPVYLYDEGSRTLNSYPLYSSNFIPATLTKGTGTNLSACIFGDWSQVVIGQWGGLEVIVDNWSGARSGQISITCVMMVDTNVRHLGSFAAFTDMLTS